MRHLIIALFICSLPITGGAPARIEQLAWLQGCWTLSSGGRTVEEQWMAPRGGVMLGTGRTVKDGKLVEYEFVVIREREGALVYEAHPSGQPSAEFVSIQVGDSEVVFENKAHDFPQRIGYRRTTAGIEAWIEGSVGGKSRKIDFPYQRGECVGK